jgi:hypothetical protein
MRSGIGDTMTIGTMNATGVNICAYIVTWQMIIAMHIAICGAHIDVHIATSTTGSLLRNIPLRTTPNPLSLGNEGWGKGHRNTGGHTIEGAAGGLPARNC